MRLLLLSFALLICVGCLGPERYCSLDLVSASVSERMDIPEEHAEDVVTVHLSYERDGYIAGELKTDVQSDRIILKVKPLNSEYGKSLGMYRVTNPEGLPIYLSDGKNMRQIYPPAGQVRTPDSAEVISTDITSEN